MNLIEKISNYDKSIIQSMYYTLEKLNPSKEWLDNYIFNSEECKKIHHEELGENVEISKKQYTIFFDSDFKIYYLSAAKQIEKLESYLFYIELNKDKNNEINGINLFYEDQKETIKLISLIEPKNIIINRKLFQLSNNHINQINLFLNNSLIVMD